MTTPYRQLIAACFIAFLVYWTWSGQRIRPAKQSEALASTLITNLLMWVGFVLLAVSSLPRFSATTFALPASTARSMAGTALVAIGVGFAIWARRVLGANWSRAPRITEGQQLVTSGPYRLVRNPIYSGILLAACGVALTSGNVLGVLGLPFVLASLWRKVLAEQRLLAAEFGEQYAEYARRVKRLIPFLL